MAEKKKIQPFPEKNTINTPIPIQGTFNLKHIQVTQPKCKMNVNKGVAKENVQS